MAIYHLSVKPVSRAGGRSATAASAYRAAERVHDLTTDQVFDYTRKRGVEHAEIVLPTEVAKLDINWARDREQLWNAAEVAENRSNSRVAREYEIALPHELTKEERLELVREFAGEIANRHGVAVDFAIHASHREGDERNWHAHMLATTREVTPTGLGEKVAIEWSDGNRRKAELGPAREEIGAIRERWATLTNEKLQEQGLEIRVDHRSLEAQGIDRHPSTHLGPAVSRMERRGIETEVGSRVREQQQAEAQLRLERAAELGRVERESQQVRGEILDLSGDLAAALRERELVRSPQQGPGRGRSFADYVQEAQVRSVGEDLGRGKGAEPRGVDVSRGVSFAESLKEAEDRLSREGDVRQRALDEQRAQDHAQQLRADEARFAREAAQKQREAQEKVERERELALPADRERERVQALEQEREANRERELERSKEQERDHGWDLER